MAAQPQGQKGGASGEPSHTFSLWDPEAWRNQRCRVNSNPPERGTKPWDSWTCGREKTSVGETESEVSQESCLTSAEGHPSNFSPRTRPSQLCCYKVKGNAVQEYTEASHVSHSPECSDFQNLIVSPHLPRMAPRRSSLMSKLKFSSSHDFISCFSTSVNGTTIHPVAPTRSLDSPQPQFTSMLHILELLHPNLSMLIPSSPSLLALSLIHLPSLPPSQGSMR